MPITPFHFGLLAPLNHWLPGRVNNLSFITANILMDLEAILYWASSQPLPEHGYMPHSFYGATVVATFACLLGIRSSGSPTIAGSWIIGALLGAMSHVLLDMLVHPEMIPLYPKDGNPFYMGWMEPISWVTLPLLVWLTAQYASGILDWMKTVLGETPEQHP